MTDPNFTGTPGLFSLTGGANPPRSGAGKAVEAFTPSRSFQSSVDSTTMIRELQDGTGDLYGTPLTHASQQLEAYLYGKNQMGFGDEPVNFMVNWSYISPTVFTVGPNGWRQE